MKKKRLTIRKELIIITVALVLLMWLVITAVSSHIYRDYVRRTAISTADTNMKFLADYIDNELDNVDELIYFCQNNSSVSSYISANEKNISVKKMKAYETLSGYCSSNSSSKYWHRVVISDLNNGFIQIVASIYSKDVNISSTLPSLNIYDELCGNGYMNYAIGLHSDPFYPKSGVEILPLLKPVTYKFTSDLGGYIFIELEDELFTDAMENSAPTERYPLILTLGQNHYLYRHSKLEPLYDSTLSESLTLPEKITLDDGNEYLVVTESLNHSNIQVSELISEDQLNEGMSPLYRLVLLLFAFLLFIGILLYYILGHTINTPVFKIKKKLSAISEGDFTRDTTIEWNHELGDVGKGVNDLAEDINELISSQVRAEREKKDLEYKVLQSQVNPHFLYNTLNSIKWMAQVQGATGISEMTTALSRLLKSLSKGTSLLIPLSEELTLLNDYFTIQKYRYGGTIAMETQIEDDSLLNCQILKFTLQPLVENAIFHGIEPTGEAGTIDVHIFTSKDKDIQIDITDHGVGMDEEKIEELLSNNTPNKSEFFKEFGVSNVHKRLRYEFGDDYGITISSRLGEYTTMSIHIPKTYESKETKDNKCTN